MKILNKAIYMQTSGNQQGFTLIELMISMVLGLLIISAALALFLGSSKNLRVQQAAADVQDASTFGLNYVTNEISMANLGAQRAMSQESAWTGIVLTGSKALKENIPDTSPVKKRHVGNLRGTKLDSSVDFDDIVSKAKTTNSVATKNPNSNVGAVGTASTIINSDQLTIQYEAPFTMNDCEGNQRDQGDMIVERFFTRQDNVGGGAGPFNIVLACDSGTYELVNPTNADDNIVPSRIAKDTFKLTGLGGDGQVLVNRVDYFHVKLGILTNSGIEYIPIDKYMTGTEDPATGETTYTHQGSIVAVKMAVLTRGVEPVSAVTPHKFDVLGDEVEISDTSSNFIRRVYDTTIYLRNGVTL